jgi:hypothetical protein
MNPPTSFSKSERTLLRAALNRIIPAQDGLPAAGDIGAVDSIETVVSGRGAERRGFLEGVGAIERTAGQMTDRDFRSLEPNEQDAVLRAVESARPDFFDELIRLAYRAYYGNTQIKLSLGLETRPPQPLGFALAPFQAELLDPVRARGPVYRKAEE